MFPDATESVLALIKQNCPALLQYNISTEILSKWILNLDNKGFWFDVLVLMFQKEVADRIIANIIHQVMADFLF